MSDQRNGGIAWTDETWNPIRGCSKVSAGCQNCYAERMAARFAKPGEPYDGVIAGGRWNGQVKLVEKHLENPLRWRRARRVFVNSMGDLFHPNVTDEWIDRVFAVMALCPQHTFQILTKRPDRMAKWFRYAVEFDNFQEQLDRLTLEVEGEPFAHRRVDEGEWPLPNVWLGVSVEDQATADERIPLLLQTPAALRFVSCEPLLGPVDLTSIPCACNGTHESSLDRECWGDCACLEPECRRRGGDGILPSINWCIVGGESGPGARPVHPDWVRSLRDQCAAVGVPFMFKQWGEYVPLASALRDQIASHQDIEAFRDMPMYRVGKKAAGRLLDGREHMEFPEVKR